jgi:hypothetical protein
VHQWERYAWIVLLIVYFCMWGLGAHQGFDIGAQQELQDTGLPYAGDFLSFGVSGLGSTPDESPCRASH